MMMTLLIVLAVIVIGLVIVIAMQPAEFRVARSTKVSAPPSEVFAQVVDFHKWEAWNPWGKIDPAMQQSYEGAPAGTGAVYLWNGNKEVGAGRMTIIESRPSELIRIKMEFFKPFAGTSTAEFAFKPEGNQTAVTWSMAGENNFMAKAIHLFMNMDKMIGGQFDNGLAQMKAQAEAVAKR
jgi:uncharacterized protein YndB with AHSA1/START domain